VLVLDGATGEGGGQILRTALALAVALGRAVALTRIRAARPKPGLQPQHLAVVRALAAISDAEVDGDRRDSTELRFTPRALRSGEWRFDVGPSSAGAVTLILQAVLLPLILAAGASRLTLVGGTHVPWSPPFQYLTEVFLPALARTGVAASATLSRWGWYPAGGGEVAATLVPGRPARGFVAPGTEAAITGLSAVSRLPRAIAERQRTRALERLEAEGLGAAIALEEDRAALGPGTILFLSVRGRAGFSALGRRGLPAERVADDAVDQLLGWRRSGAALDEHLADQLVPYLALAPGASSYTCPRITGHLRTVAELVGRFLPVEITLEDSRPAEVRIAR